MRRIRIAAVLGAALLWSTPVTAQTRMVEGGVSGLGIDAVFENAGSYFGGSVGIDWFSVVGGVNMPGAGIGATVQVGTAFTLGAGTSVARPSVRVGSLLVFDGFNRLTGGFGIHIGRRVGLAVTADMTRLKGLPVTVTHVGAYYSF